MQDRVGPSRGGVLRVRVYFRLWSSGPAASPACEFFSVILVWRLRDHVRRRAGVLRFDRQVKTVSVDGRTRGTLYDGDMRIRSPRVSPDGRQVLFWTGPIYRVELQHGMIHDDDIVRVTPLGCGGTGPSWSPTGSHIAFWNIERKDVLFQPRVRVYGWDRVRRGRLHTTGIVAV